MVNYVYKVCWNECNDEDIFSTFPEAKDFINQKTATGNPNYVSPFIYEIELADDENGMFVPTGNDVCVFSWDSQTGQPDIRKPKLFDDSEYEDADFEIYDVFDTEKEPEPAEPEVDPYDGRNLFNFDEAVSKLNEADENFGECQCCHEEFPKEELVKEGSRFVCKNCAGNLTEALKIISDISEYKPWSGAVATWDKIEAANKVDELEALIEEVYPDGITMTELNDILWFDSDWILETLGLDTDVEESLEDTVPEDLADDRTPKQGNVHVLEQPVDYKAEIAKEKLVDENLHEDLNQDIKKWNEYVKYLQEQIAKEEKALERAGENELVKKAIQRRIDAFKADLEEALPNIVKNAEPEISEVSDAEEKPVEEKPVEEAKKPKKLKESFNQEELKRYMAAAEKLGIKTGSDLMKFSKEHGDVKDKALLDAMEAEANKQK